MEPVSSSNTGQSPPFSSKNCWTDAGLSSKVTLTIELSDDVSRRVRLAGTVRYSDDWNEGRDGERLELTFDPRSERFDTFVFTLAVKGKDTGQPVGLTLEFAVWSRPVMSGDEDALLLTS